MHPKLEKQFRERAVALGNSGDPAVLPDLAELARSPVANVRRLAASAMGKLAGLANGRMAVAALQPMLQDSHRRFGNMPQRHWGTTGPRLDAPLPTCVTWPSARWKRSTTTRARKRRLS